MKFTYEITMCEPERDFLQIKFINEDGEEYWKNIKHEVWEPESVKAAVAAHGPEIAAFWDRVKNRDNKALAEKIQLTGEFECEPEKYFVETPEWPQMRDAPEFDPFTQRIQEREWELGVDEWIEWDIIPLTAEEQAEFAATVAGDIRSQRNWMLITTDYIYSPDCQIEDKGPWEVYRQALRDVPQQPGFPKSVTWPEHP